MRSRWSVRIHHHPLLLPCPRMLGRNSNMPQNLNVPSPISNHHWTIANEIIQWNCRGLKANFNELLLLLTALCPSIVCLEETSFKPNDNLNIRGYTLYNHIHQAGDMASGGSSVIINNSVPHSQILLNTNLQAIAAKATLHKTIHVCSLYLPPNSRINIADLEHLIQHLPKPFIIMGDFNSHSNVWGCRDTDQKGRIIEDVINRNNLILYVN